MSNEEIQAEVANQYSIIECAKERIDELRTICKHEKTFQGKYSWRTGATVNAEICVFCQKFIKAIE